MFALQCFGTGVFVCFALGGSKAWVRESLVWLFLEQMPKHESLSLSIREPLNAWILESLNAWILESLNPGGFESLTLWILGSRCSNLFFPQTCFSMRGSDWSMVENRVNLIEVVARLRAQFFSCFLTKNIARTVYSMLCWHCRACAHSFYHTFWKPAFRNAQFLHNFLKTTILRAQFL